MGAATCEDSLVLFENLAATVAGQTPPATGVSTVEECRARCLQDERCAGLNWMRDGRNDTDKCLLYSVLIGDTTVLNLFDLYVRERCQPNMFITFGPGLYMCVHVPYSYYLFLLTFPICIFPSSFLCVLPSLQFLLLSLTFQNMDLLRFQAVGRRRRPNLGLVCFVLMFTVFLVKDACLFRSCWLSFSLVM